MRSFRCLEGSWVRWDFEWSGSYRSAHDTAESYLESELPHTVNISVTTTQDIEMWNCSSYLLHCLMLLSMFLSWVFQHVVDVYCVLRNVIIMQLWTWCLSFIGLHWYCKYTQKLSRNCICYSCTSRCIANEIEFCRSCFLGVVLRLFAVLQGFECYCKKRECAWTRSQSFHSSEWSWNLWSKWQMRGVILRPDSRVLCFLSLCSK